MKTTQNPANAFIHELFGGSCGLDFYCYLLTLVRKYLNNRQEQWDSIVT